MPLLFLGRGVAAGRDDTPVGHVDLLPTLLDALGLSPAQPGDGVSLWPSLRGEAPAPRRPLLFEGTLYGPEQKGVVDWPYKLVWWPGEDRSELYDLARDPGETRPLADAQPVRERLLAWLRDATAEAAASRAGPQSAEPSAETLEALRELGYAE